MRSLKLACIRDGHSVDVVADPSHGWDDFQKLLKKKFGMSVWLRYSNRQKELVAVCDAASYRDFLAFCRLRALKDGVEEVRNFFARKPAFHFLRQYSHICSGFGFS
jgi:hypothetical protein